MNIAGMTLDKFLRATGVTELAIAEKIGRDRTFVNRLRRGVAVPSLETVARIEKATDGAVTARDFIRAREDAA